MANEIELKLAFPAHVLEQVLAHPLIANAPRKGPPRVLDNSYFDTPELTLHAARIAVRTRRMGSTVLQTVKCAAESVGGLSSRPEWEQPFKKAFDFSAVDIKPVRKMLQSLAGELQPVFTTIFHRETRIVQPVPEVSILAMIDTGKIIAGTRETPICELELELAQGGAGDLINLAISLAEDLPLIPFDLSKAQRGYLLFCNDPVKPLRFGKSQIHAGLTPLQTFRSIATQAESCWLGNLHGALDSKNPEFIHQLRVALRRLKTLLKVCKPILPPDFILRWKATLSTLASVSGEARDLDVLRESILLPLLCSESESTIEPLMRRSLQDCAQARESANEKLALMPHGVYLLTFNKELHRLIEPSKPQDMTRFARKRLERLHANVSRRLDAVRQNPTAEMLHRLRIGFKNLRYTCDFLAPLFDEGEFNRFAREVAELQDELGFLHDLETALNRLDLWAIDAPELKEAREHVAQWHSQRAEKVVGKISDEAGKLLARKAPWQ